MNRKISDKDKKDWENFLSKKEKLKNKDNISETQKIIKKRSLDLHGYTLAAANEKVDEFIKKAYADKVEKLIIVTGKGLHSTNNESPYISEEYGILKYSVPEFIKNKNDLISKIKYFSKAKHEDGGDGAFYIFLRKKK